MNGPTTRYENDPLRGNPRHHAILRMHKNGLDERKIAKRVHMSTEEVRQVIQQVEAATPRRDRGERRDGGGFSDSHHQAAKLTKNADNVLSHWDKLGQEWKVKVVQEMLWRLGRDGVDEAYDALKTLSS